MWHGELMARLASLPHAAEPRDAWRLIMEAYLTEVQMRSGSLASAKNYRYYLLHFFKHIPDPGNATPGAVRVWAYGPSKRTQVPSASVVLSRLASVSGLYEFALSADVVTENPCIRIPRPRQPRRPRYALRDSELARVLRGCTDQPTGIRHRAFILFAVMTGLRKQEILDLCGGSFDRRDDGSWWYRTTREKGGNTRLRELTPPCRYVLEAALETDGRSLRTLKASEPVWPWKPGGIWCAVKRAGERSGVKVTVHTLRHCAAVFSFESHGDIKAVQQMLGHRYVSSTDAYLRSLMGEPDAGAAEVAKRLGIGTEEKARRRLGLRP